MKALFITTETSDCANHVRAWNSCFPAADHLTFNHKGIRNDWLFLERARGADVIFYIGAHEAAGNPKWATLNALRSIAPSVLLCSDAADQPWHKTIEAYRRHQCFDLYVSLDGARDAPVDLATLTPVDPSVFSARERDIRCGFSGTVGRWNTRSEMVNALMWFGGLTVRRRAREDGYQEHGDFLSRCCMLINTSWTGTGQAHHIKGRVLEAGFAGCALLEYADSPIGEWFPQGCWMPWRTPPEAAEIIASGDEITRVAQNLAREVRERFSPRQIYGQILESLNLVDPAEQKPAA